jgi:hypothetical protein
VERTTDLEIVGVVDRGFGAKGLAFFVVLLDLGLLVLNVQRGHNPLGQNARAEAPRRATGDTPVEDQLHLIGSAEIEILPDDLLEETTPRDRPIEHLGQGELGLQDRELIPITGRPVRWGEGMRQATQPFAKDGVDLGGVQRVGDSLDAAGRIARADAVVQGLERHPRCVSCRFNTHAH